MAGPVKITIVNIGSLSMNRFWGETRRVRTPTVTCTLLEVKDHFIIVDPSPMTDLLERMLFARTGLRPGEVHQVFLKPILQEGDSRSSGH